LIEEVVADRLDVISIRVVHPSREAVWCEPNNNLREALMDIRERSPGETTSTSK
jgi:hypothetical protein